MLASRHFACFLSGIFLVLGSAAWADTVHLASNEKATEQGIATLLIKDIYARAGHTAKIEPLPGLRATALVLAGEKDGEVARVLTYANRNPGLIKVDPPYYYLSTTAFAKTNSGIRIQSASDLKKYRVGVVRGIAHAEAATTGLARVEIANDYQSLYRMLDKNRIDVAVDTSVNGPVVLQQLGLSGISAAGEIARLDLFHMLHGRKAELAPAIGATIKSLKDSGELLRTTQRLEAEFLKNGPPH